MFKTIHLTENVQSIFYTFLRHSEHACENITGGLKKPSWCKQLAGTCSKYTTLLEYLDVTKPSRCIATKCLLVVPRSSSCGCLFVTFIVIQVLISFLATVNSFASPQSILVMFHLVIPFGYPFGYLHVMLCPFVYLIH